MFLDQKTVALDTPKKSRKADRKGGEGGSTRTVSLTVKYPFFDDFPYTFVGILIISDSSPDLIMYAVVEHFS